MRPPQVARGWAGARLPCVLLALLFVCAPTHQAAAQTYDPLAQARRLEAAGEYWAAAASLRAYLWSHPEDAAVRWPLGRLLYWLGRPDEAFAEYDTALTVLPDEPWLHIDRATILMDRGDLTEAETALENALRSARGDRTDDGAAVEAQARLGTVAYWRGDFTRAARLFRAVHQPFRRRTGFLEAGTFVNPLWTVAAGGTARSLDVTGASLAADGWVRLKGSLPGPRAGVTLQLGRAWQTSLTGRSGAWTGQLQLGVEVAPQVRVRGRGWSERYLWTLASADTLVMVRGLELVLDGAAARRWAGEAALRRERLSGETTIHTAYGWMLAPILPWLRGGYALSWQDSDQTRWTLADPNSSMGPGQGMGPGGPMGQGPDLAGVYAPYFTPEATVVHSALAELQGRAGFATARLSLSYGFRAVEQAPSFQVVGAGPLGEVRTVYAERRFSPWRIVGSLGLPVGCCASLLLEAERERTAFYEATRVSLGVVYRFVPAPLARTP
ncbi:MAG: tetratricopeptide repeat protein [Gemmatimonadota bacterium]